MYFEITLQFSIKYNLKRFLDLYPNTFSNTIWYKHCSKDNKEWKNDFFIFTAILSGINKSLVHIKLKKHAATKQSTISTDTLNISGKKYST